MRAERILLGGVVQGVGFRPFVYRLARTQGLHGWVRNRAGMVEILVQGTDTALTAFRAALLHQAPPAARPELAAIIPASFSGYDFAIIESGGAAETIQGLPPDLAPCPACLAELADPANRRHRYPFINCTQCGPRYSLIRALPYDRANTAMAGFALCPACATEYNNLADRRFHAEPIACPACGPDLRAGEHAGAGALAACLALLRAGGIAAVKGVGGYHLLCDAANAKAVAHLRARKHRPDKPLALLLPETMLQTYVQADEAALAFLRAPTRPIMLLPRRKHAPLAPNIAPGLDEIGVMLADSPLHALLAEGFGRALVATSANRAGEPMITDDATAQTALAGVAALILRHDRPIERAVDDSVLRIIGGSPHILRAGRGLSPIEMRLPFTLDEPVLACGGHMKSTIALGFGNRAVISPHLGTLDNPAALAGFASMAADLQTLYGVRAARLLVDAHTGHASARWARAQGLAVETIWHHHAHASALAGEYGEGGTDMLVFTWDGLGLGPDGRLWGGEALLGRPGAWRVAARLRPFRLQGGDAVARSPWRSAAALCWQAGIAPPDGLVPDDLAYQAWARGLNCHESTAMGRLFDAAAALLGLVHTTSYEAQAPALLEALAGDDLPMADPLPLRLDDTGVLEADWAPLLPLLRDESLPPARRAALFHATLAATGLAMARRMNVSCIGLAGGVFQNRKLAEALLTGLRAAGFKSLIGRQIPANDAGLSFGQIVEHGGRTWMMR